MRTRLFLSAAVATLSLCLSQGYAQQAGRQPAGGESAKQGESTRMQKPDEKGGAEQRSERRDMRAQEQTREHGAQQQPAEKQERHGAAAKDEEQRAAAKDEQKREATKAEDKNEAAKGAERHGGAKKGEKHGAGTRDEHRGAMGEDRNHAAAQGAAKNERQERAGETATERTGPNERTGAATTGNERRPSQAEGERAGRFGQAEHGQAERGQAERGQIERGQAGREQAERRGENLPAGAEQQRQGAERSMGSETTRGAEATPRGGREAYGNAGREARGGRVQLSERQQNRVRSLLEQRGARSFTRNDFNVQIGAVAPPSVQFYPLPPDVVSMVPQFRGYDYVMVDNDIAIIDPGTREVVSVLGEGGPPAATYGYEEREGGGYYGGPGGYERREGREGRGYGMARRGEEGYRGGGRERRGEAYGYAPRVRLDTRQERALYRGIISETRSNLRQVCVRVGDRVPESVDIEPVPRNIAAEAPDAERFDYFVLNDQVVLVDPDTRVVVDMIEQPR